MRLFLFGLLVGLLVTSVRYGELTAASNDRIVNRAVAFQSLQSSAALFLLIPKSPPIEAAFCGGTFLAADLVLTAAHCVRGPLAERARVRAFSGRSSGMTVEKYCEPCDLALLRLKEPTGERNAILSSDVAPGDSIQLIGSPDGEPFMSTWGRVSKILPSESFGVCPSPEPKPDTPPLPPNLTGTKPQQLLMLNIILFFGDSGGGVYGDRGEFLGVLVQGHTAAEECAPYLGEMVMWGYAVGPEAIKEFLEGVK